MREYTRANDFDRIVGRLQTYNVINYGVGNSILDVGCGIGEYTPIYLERFMEVTGLDSNKDCLKEARMNTKIDYVEGWGETFKIDKKFDTISLNNILEHANDPVLLLSNCKKHLRYGGRIIVQVPNAETPARTLGVLMKIIPSLTHISEKESGFWGHKRTYMLDTLRRDCRNAGLEVVDTGGILYKPLPNEDLLKLYKEKGESFVEALLTYGRNTPRDCACIYAVCE